MAYIWRVVYRELYKEFPVFDNQWFTSLEACEQHIVDLQLDIEDGLQYFIQAWPAHLKHLDGEFTNTFEW